MHHTTASEAHMPPPSPHPTTSSPPETSQPCSASPPTGSTLNHGVVACPITLGRNRRYRHPPILELFETIEGTDI